MSGAAVASIAARSLSIPFRVAFKHAAAERAQTAAVWVEARDAAGHAGCGEGCPREYVTGESVAGALAFIDAHREVLRREVGDVASLAAYAQRHEAAIDASPAAWCALELALLDLFGCAAGCSVEALLGLPELAGPFRYTAVLGDASLEAFSAQAQQYRRLGFDDFKVKLSGDRARDGARLEALAGLGAARIRVDANNLWRSPVEALAHLASLPAPLFAVEEPLGAGDLDGLAAVADALGVPVILDESCARAGPIRTLPGPAARWIVNVRVSKMGGIGRALAAVAAAREAGVRVIVGAQVGETSVLTRAALPVAAAAGGALAGQEGAFGTLLLAQDVAAPSLMFGAGGVLDPAPVAGRPGLGLALRPPGPAAP
ncbi:MAG: enolase C-terminal domain-like protein [Pseudomonadota bacterium]